MTTNCKLELNNIETKWLDLLKESSIWLNKYELFELIDDMQRKDININTLSFQVCHDGSFVAKVDISTKQYYSYIINN